MGVCAQDPLKRRTRTFRGAQKPLPVTPRRARHKRFDNIKVNKEWAFESVRSTGQWTHGYHRYPAKFLPDVVKKLIETYTENGKTVADLFAGCGTTLVEAKVHGLKSVGTDINPVATLITEVKTTPIAPDKLLKQYRNFTSKFERFDEKKFANLRAHERIDHWFRPSEKMKIAYLYKLADGVEDEVIKKFFLVAISHILKNCSWWLQSSTKPHVDPNKNIPDPFSTFKHHCLKMMKGNEQFYNELKKKHFLGVECKIHKEDARHVAKIKDSSVDIIITSPPYVTSYEYADIHQLTGYWMKYFSDISSFRKSFIGTSFSGNRSLNVPGSSLGKEIVEKLDDKGHRIAGDVANYFNDMQAVAKEMFRILKKNGRACIVIGNTTLKNVHIKSAEVLYDYLMDAGFKDLQVIKRNIPNKLIPTLRDKVTGKFTTLENKDCKRVYPNEYIIVVEK